MKILLLPAYFRPEQIASSYLTENRNKAFADAGIKMLCYAPTPTRGIVPDDRKKYSRIKKEFLYEGAMELHRFPMFKERRNPLQRAFRYFLCCLTQLWKGLWTKDVDLILLSSTPPILGLVGVLLKKIKHIPFVYNLQDVFPESLNLAGFIQKKSFIWYFGRKIEDFIYRNSDKIIVISHDLKLNLIQKGVPNEKIEVIYNWVDQNKIIEVSRSRNRIFDRYSLDKDKFYITYCGNFGLTQNLDMLLEVAKELKIYKNIQFILIGDGVYKKRLEEKVNDVQNVFIYPFQPYAEISDVFSLGDVGLVISKPGIAGTSFPSKTWNILAAGRPVLASFDESELQSILTKNCCGFFTESGNQKSFSEAILYLYNHRDECVEMGKNGRNYVLKHLTKEEGTKKYVDVVKRFERVS